MQVAKIQGMFLDKVKQGLSKDALCLESNPEKRDGLAVAFVVNTARMQADIKRDLEKGGAATCNFKMIKCWIPVPSSFQTLLVVIKPTSKPNQEQAQLPVASSLAPHIKEVVSLFVDVNVTRMHACNTNTETINSVLRFLKSSITQQ